MRKTQSAQWAPEDEELRKGIDFINSQAPEGDALNEQTFWILSSIREQSGTPIEGWPESKVRGMAQNKSRGLAGAQPLSHYPLHTYSMKDFMSTVLLPLIYPLLVVHGIIMVGWPGVGKTPALICMILAIGRYHIRKLGLNAQPSWRRSKALDNFRHRIPQLYEGVFLDDPSREKIDLADLKSYLTAEEDQTCSGRYNDIKLVRGQVRAYAGNHLKAEDEPEPDTRKSITPEEMLKLLRHTFVGEKDADVMAVLKRAIVFVYGKHALYLRLPTEASDGMIHRIVGDDVHLDVLASRFFGDYKIGSIKKGDDFDEAVQREQEMIQKSFGRMEEMGQKRYVEHCNETLKQHLQPPAPVPAVRWLPSSPSTPEEDAVADTLPFSVQLASRDAPRKRLTNASKFVYPTPERRLRRKQSDASQNLYRSNTVASSADRVEGPALATSPGDEMDVQEDADEEAARALHN